jgi:hypothetical protein
MRTHTISVTIGKGSITVRPERQVMTMDDEVQWTSAEGRGFSIEFDGPGPFAAPRLAFAAATARQRPRAQGRFKYSVVSDDDPGLKLDPEVIIDPPPSKVDG